MLVSSNLSRIHGIILCCILFLQDHGIEATDILSLPLIELVKKLKEESFSPESVLYTYMEKVRKRNCHL